MKKMTKILLAAGGAALICGGSVMTYLKAQTQQPKMSDLTLANIEALAVIENIGGENVWHVYPLDDYGSKQCDRGGTAFCYIEY